MKLRYVLYVLLLLTISISFWTYVRIGEIEERMEREKARLNRLLRDTRIKTEKLRKLKLKISEEGLERYTEMKALEVLFGYVDKLKGKGFEVNIVREAVREGSSWKMDLKLAFEPKDSRAVASELEKLLSSKAPVVLLRGLYMDAEEGRVEILLSLYQPFAGEKR